MCNGDAGPVGLLASWWGLLPVGLCMGELSELRAQPSKNAGGTPRIIADDGSSGADQP